MSVTSATWWVPDSPAVRIPSKTATRFASPMSTPTTRAPPAAHFSAISLPNPPPAPVTRTTLSCRCCGIAGLPTTRIRLTVPVQCRWPVRRPADLPGDRPEVGTPRHGPGRYGRFVKRRTAMGLPLLLAAGPSLSRLPRAGAAPSRWSVDRANRWYRAQGWPVGSNYITSTAVNQLEMFQPGTFDLRRIDAELGWARSAGLNTVRVFLHDQLWAADRKGFQYRLAQFVSVAARRRIKPLFVLFDSCWDPFPKAGPQPGPRPGIHNSRWVQSPGAERLGDRDYYRTLYDYVTGVMSQFRYDQRILGWDLWNEPDNMAREYS